MAPYHLVFLASYPFDRTGRNDTRAYHQLRQEMHRFAKAHHVLGEMAVAHLSFSYRGGVGQPMVDLRVLCAYDVDPAWADEHTAWFRVVLADSRADGAGAASAPIGARALSPGPYPP